MYNRYIPQSDGSYRKSTVREQPAVHPRTPAVPPPVPPRPPEKAEPSHAFPCEQSPPPCAQPPQQSASALSFLRRLIPQGLDTGDLLVIILLLLMAGDSAEENHTALLTLALYLFM